MNVKNSRVIRRLTWRNLKSRRFRNWMAICAIALTAILFTTIATMGGAILQSFEENTFRQVGTSSHGGYKYLNEEKYAKLLAAEGYEDISYDIILGFARNPEFAKKQHELRYAEEKKARWGFSYPTVGHMPQAFRDIALSTLTLDLLELPHELGQTIHLEFMVGDTLHADDFTLVGHWPGDDVMMAAQCYLAKDYVRTYAPDKGDATGNNDYTGAISVDVWFRNSVDIEGKLEQLTLAAGLDPDETRVAVNWAYLGAGAPDATTLILIGSMLLLVMLSGYLIIYSIFAISVSGDIQFYGLLKTIGTTGRQIKRIVRGQALLLSAVGIPIGLALGFVLGTQLAPIMMDILTYDTPATIRANPLIFLFAALFSLVTVLISSHKPGKIAGRVSPIEALRYTEGASIKQKEKKARKVTPASMAWANVGRSKRKLLTVLLSLSLSMVLLNSVTSVVKGFDMDRYLENRVITDFYFTDEAALNPSIPFENRDFEAIPDRLQEEAAALPGLDALGRVYYKIKQHTFPSPDIQKRFEEIVTPYAGHEWMKAALTNALNDNQTSFQIYGVEQLAFEKIRDNFQDIDWEKFSSGAYALINTFDGSDSAEAAYYKIGEKIPLEGADGKLHEVEVLGYMDYPYAMSSQFSLFIDCDLLLSAETFTALFGRQQPFSLLLDVQDGYIESTEQWTQNLTGGEMRALASRSKAFFQGEFQTLKSTYLLLGGVLAFVLALIGILNFINTMVTSIMTRKRELAMLQSVGMTNAQLRQQLFFEGLWYAVLTLLLTLTVGTLVSMALVQGIAGTIWFFRFTFSPAPLLICAPILLVLCALIPLLSARILQKESLVERLREN